MVGIGLIGAGNFARNLHLPNIDRIPECDLRMVCDLDPAVRQDIGERYGCATTADLHQVLQEPDIEVVVIAVRDDLQADIAVAALQAGKHVYVEKPLAETPEACAPVVSALEASGCRLAVGFNRRFAPIYRKARELVQADGGCFNIHIRMADDAWRWAHGYPPGYLIKHDVCHFFDLLRWFTGQDIVGVYAGASRPDDDAMLLHLSGGCVCTIMQSGHGTMDMPKERFEIISKRGGVTAEDFVELRTFGYPDAEPKYTFAGHSHPDREFMHKYLYKALGLDGLSALRRMTWEMRQKVQEDGALDNDPDAEEMRRFAMQTIPNFMRDQGWMDSLRGFVLAVRDGGHTDHASAADALRAAQVADAVVKSRDSGEIVRLD